MATLKHKFLEPNQLGYFSRYVGSKLRDSIRWFEFLMHHNDIHIAHTYNGGESKCDGITVRGFDAQNNTVYEFLDCFDDGCPKCEPRRVKPYQNTERKRRSLERLGYVMVQMWSCEFYAQRSSSAAYRAFTQEVPVAWDQPLNVRDTFYGGRTNAARLYAKCEPHERIKYVDFTSLYPWVNKRGQYPMGHPKILTSPSLEKLRQREYFGVVKCRMVPPRNLFHPVLPVRYRGKLMFPLCRTCVESKSPDCNHSGEARSFAGTWCTPEIYRAFDEGYTVLDIKEVHHFDTTRTGLFSEYVNTFLKAKQECSGWPKPSMTDEDKDTYIRNYQLHEGISLERESIAKNPGMRATAKLVLVALWGKFGQRGNMTQSKICLTAKDFYALVLNERYDISGLFRCPGNPDVVELLYCEKDFTATEPRNTNVYVACFTTCHARLRLYDVLSKLGRRVLYYDTDSVIYIQSIHDECSIRLGAYLGDLTDELCSDGTRYITEFVSTGPKSYSYRDNDNNVKCKFKGVTKTLYNINLINFKSMLECVEGGIYHTVEGVENLLFIKDRFGRVKTDYVPKVFRMVYDKRWIRSDYVTFPFGF